MTAESLNLTTAVDSLIGYLESLDNGTVVTKAYRERLWNHYIANLKAAMENKTSGILVDGLSFTQSDIGHLVNIYNRTDNSDKPEKDLLFRAIKICKQVLCTPESVMNKQIMEEARNGTIGRTPDADDSSAATPSSTQQPDDVSRSRGLIDAKCQEEAKEKGVKVPKATPDDASRKAFEEIALHHWPTVSLERDAAGYTNIGIDAAWDGFQWSNAAWRESLQKPNLSDQQLRLHFGELTDQGIRDVRAALNFADAKWRERLKSEGVKKGTIAIKRKTKGWKLNPDDPEKLARAVIAAILGKADAQSGDGK